MSFHLRIYIQNSNKIIILINPFRRNFSFYNFTKYTFFFCHKILKEAQFKNLKGLSYNGLLCSAGSRDIRVQFSTGPFYFTLVSTNFPAFSNSISLLINFLIVSLKSEILTLICLVVSLSLIVTSFFFKESSSTVMQ